MRRVLWLLLAAAIFAPPLWADPCGLVPPIATRTDPDRYLTREGEQITYVFFKNGIQDVVLRPAFKGKVSEFGMLIPFPSPPAIRKVADDIFPQVAAAVTPPRVTINVSPPLPRAASVATRQFAASTGGGLKYKGGVRVIKEEAVGMYQVAVLEAGSAAALKNWMTAHGYVYPEGMDRPAQQYVDKGWCFVAVKARVGKKKGVEPKPGMKKTDPDLPEDATFSGAVQAMGFRFRVEEPVVPMRLSAYNPGKLFNIVYALTEKPVRFKELPERFVEKQLPGRELMLNVTLPLQATYTYREIVEQNGRRRSALRRLEVARGGLPGELPPDARKQWESRKAFYESKRDPAPHNGKARALFASDLLAARRGRLIHEFEERQKELLNIGEELKLRGPEVDALIHEQIEEWKREELGQVIQDLDGMTLTVIKGDFPREVLRDNDLTFLAFARDGKPIQKQGMAGPWFFVILFAAAGIAACFRRSRRAGGAAAVALLAGTFALSAPARPQETEEARLARALADRSKRAETVASIFEQGLRSAPALRSVAALRGADLSARGWAIICLARLEDGGAVEPLAWLAQDAAEPQLVRLWAIGGMASIKPDRAFEVILDRLSRTNVMWGTRIRPNSPTSDFDGALLALVTKSFGRRYASKLVGQCLQGKNDAVRRLSAALLGGAGIDSEPIRKEYIAALKFDRKLADAGRTPWEKGSLFVPGVQWTQDQLGQLVVSLSRWHEWAALNKRTADLRIISNNMNSLQRRMRSRR